MITTYEITIKSEVEAPQTMKKLNFTEVRTIDKRDCIIRSRDRTSGLRFFTRNNKICASGCEPDTSRRLFFANLQNRKKDLTRYGIEPNPGPQQYLLLSQIHNLEQDVLKCDFESQSPLCEFEDLPDFGKLCRTKGFHQPITGWYWLELYLENLEKQKQIEDLKYQLQDLEIQTPVSLSEEAEYIIKLTENIITFMRLIMKAKDREDYILAIAVFAQCRSNKSLTSLLLEQWNNLMEFSFQDGSDETLFSKFKDALRNYESIKRLPIFTKLYRFLMFCIGTSLFDKMGVKFDKKRFSKIEQEALKNEYHLGPDFIHCVLDTIVFLSETGYQCMVTGTLDPILHHESSYDAWIKKSEDLRIKSKFITNPEPHGFTVFEFLSDLDECIDKGNAMVKFLPKKDAGVMIVRKLLSDLENIRADCKTKRLAQQERKAPFAVLVHGGSSVAKSQFTKLLFYHYGKLFNLPIGDEFKYTRNAFDQYWTNFNSSQWCLQLDDIAYLHPNSAQGCDPSLVEMLQVVNNVPYVPTQADISDKGKTPVQARLVIATSNTETLNAETYFACPLAVQRRLPYVISIEPKKEYRRDNGPMIDPRKIPISEPGEYPDLWRITVKRVVPVDKSVRPVLHMGQTAELITENIFEDIYSFLNWFNGVAKSAEMIQSQALKCDEDMRQVELCKHEIPKKKCVDPVCNQIMITLQSGEIIHVDHFIPTTPWMERVYQRMRDNIDSEPDDVGREFTIKKILENISTMSWVNRIIVMWYYFILWFMDRFWFGKPVVYFLYGRWYFFFIAAKLMHIPEMRHICFWLLGYKAYRFIRKPKVVVFCAAIAAAVTLLKTSRYLLNFAANTNQKEHDFLCGGCDKCKQKVECKSCTNFQGSSADRGVSPQSKGDKHENVWYKDTFECTPFDVTPSTLSMNKWSLDDMVKHIQRNCVYYIARGRTEDTIKEKFGKGICIGGHVYMFNNHCLPFESFELEIVNQNRKDGITTNITTLVTPDQCLRYPHKDVIFVNLPAIPPKKDIRDLFAKESFKGRFDGQYVSRAQDGQVTTVPFKNTQLIENFQFADINKDAYIDCNVWKGVVPDVTKMGDCGSTLIIKSAMGPIILGFHVLGGRPGEAFSLQITKEFLDKQHFVIMSNNSPTLQVGAYKQELVNLHPKSTVRYIENGTVEVYGSLAGFRGALKSRVTETLMSDLAVSNGYIKETGAPLMNSYIPWRRAMIDMSRPVTHIDLTLLKHCTQSFAHDILSKLTESDLKELVVYDTLTAVNGKPGLAYVDKMPRNTSAGFPFRKSKKYFLESIDAVDDLQHPVKVSGGIECEMDKIIDCYESGKVYCPVFTASLKDEPTKISKILEGKTRVFCGAPMPWSLVVRKYLLSTIRIIQKNRFLFEAGPGTIAQSTEWDDIYKYVTQFGEDRIVAGDYGKFDKRMPASVILAAFDIIKSMLVAAGWSERDLKVIQGIAEDTAYPTIDFNGDLIRCYGTNPSGHPLTVIINGLANSLYVRYCYTTLHPQRSCDDFKRHIALMTYGDDMIMGVNKACTWLDHTKMQQVLADIDIEFTMAEKTAASVPFINISQATFLRRSWRFEPELNVRVCPIEHASIDKMLTMCVESRTICKELQALAVLETATREYFWYGKEIFEIKRKLFYSWIETLNLQLYMDRELPTWDFLILEFKNNSKLRN